MLEKILVGDRRYWTWVLFLLAIFAVGFGTFTWQRLSPEEISGMSRDVAWGFYIANYTFLVGVAASAVMVVLPYYLHNQKEFGPITALGEFLGAGAVAAAILFIMVDIGQPFRVWNMFLHPTPNSPFFWNSVILPGYFLLSVIAAWFTLDAERDGIKPPSWVKWIILISIPWAISIHTVTSFVYSGLPARPFWNTAILTPRFLSSAFASGPAMLILLALLVRRVSKFDPGTKAIQKVALIVTYAMIINMFFLLVEVWVAVYSDVPAELDHFKYVYFGLEGHNALVPWAWVSLILGLGSAVALVFPRVRNNEKWLALACAVVFVATWIDKGMVLVIGGFIPSPLATITEYLPSLPEVLIALGVYALALLILTVLYKIAIAVKEEVVA